MDSLDLAPVILTTISFFSTTCCQMEVTYLIQSQKRIVRTKTLYYSFLQFYMEEFFYQKIKKEQLYDNP